MTRESHKPGASTPATDLPDDVDASNMESAGLSDPEFAVSITRSLRDVAPPPPRIRQVLLALGQGPSRFVPFLDRVARLFDLPERATERVLATIDEPDAWSLLRPGTSYFDVQAGPALGTRHAGIVRMTRGAYFPNHIHRGEEHSLILQGCALDSNGVRVHPGEELVYPDGTCHSVNVVGEVDLIYAIVLGEYELLED